MPIIRSEYIQPGVELEIWEIEETEAFFLDLMNLSNEETKHLEVITGYRRVEWLAGRYLLKQNVREISNGICAIDDAGKPFLEDTDLQFSLSHSNGRVALLLSKKQVGVDIQRIQPKITRIAHKFISEAEWKSVTPDFEIEAMHILWGAKEALYKAYGKRQLEFIDHILIEPFDPTFVGKTTGRVEKEGYIEHYDIKYEIADAFALITAIQTD